MADIQAEALSAYQRAKAEFEKASQAVRGIIPEVKDAIPQAETDVKNAVQDAVPDVQELMQTVSNLYAQITELKKQGAAGIGQIAQAVASDFVQGGEPVPHNLHLDDGSVVSGFKGVATHIANADGSVRRVVAAYPVNPTTAKV